MAYSGDILLKPAGPAPATRAPAVLVFLLAGGLSFVALWLVQGPRTWLVYFGATGAVLASTVVLLVRRRTRLRPLAFAAGWLATPLLLLGALLWMTGTLGDYVLVRRFDPEVWRAKAGADPEDRTRLRMVDDLRSSGRLDRLAREDVVRLLGEPLESTGDEWVWRVGRGAMIDDTYLRIRFGPDGRVIGHDLFQS